MRDRGDIVASIQAALPELKEKLPVRRVVLFGSFAKGRATAHSDVDLLVVYEGPPREDAFATALLNERVANPRLRANLRDSGP